MSMIHIMHSFIKRIEQILLHAGTMDDYFIHKKKYEDKIKQTQNRKKILHYRRIIAKYGQLVEWNSWKNEKKEERNLIEKAFNVDSIYISYKEEINYIKQCGGKLPLYPYSFIEKYSVDSIKVEEILIDTVAKRYIEHNGRRLFFPNYMTDEDIKDVYNQLIMEQDYDSPHRYFSKNVSFMKGDVFVDVGGAEGIVSLDVLDSASEVIIIEHSKEWIDALKHTFEGEEKVKIVDAYAGEIDSRDIRSLDSILCNYRGRNIYIKIDVEGMEIDTLRGATEVMKNNNCKFAVATYHNNSQYQEIKTFFNEQDFIIEDSKGYMLFTAGYMTLENGKYEKIKPPYFRHGLVRAYKIPEG